MTTVIVCIVIAMTVSGAVMGALDYAYKSPAYADFHFRDPLPTRATPEEARRLFVLNTVISVGMIFGGAILGYPWLFSDAPISAGLMALQAVGILLIYDLIYYALHRWVFHHPKLMKYVHGLHHRARTPAANESIYTHPAEMVAGLLVLLASLLIVGPVHPIAFGVAFFIYSVMNVVIHSGLEFPLAPLSLLNGPTRKHYRHHGVNVNKNFGSLTPIWDLLFGTAI